MSKRLAHVLSLTGLMLLASASVRCVSVSPGVAVELIFAAPPHYEPEGPVVSSAAAFLVAATLVPCEEAPRASWRSFGIVVAHAHTDSTSARTWLGGQRVDAMSAAGTPLGLLSPPARSYCELEVTFAPDETAETDPREDPMVGRSLGVEGSYENADGSITAFAVRTSRERVELIPFDAPLVLDDARDLARITVSFDAAAWAENMNFEAASASERRAALLDELHAYLAATVEMREQER